MASLSVAELWASMEESSCRKRYGRDIMSKEYGQVVRAGARAVYTTTCH